MGSVVARSGIEDFKVTEFYDFYYMWMSFATVLQLKLPVGNKAFTLEHEETVYDAVSLWLVTSDGKCFL